MTEAEALHKATPRARVLLIPTALVWIIVLGGTWWLTRGDYYATFPSELWLLAWIVVGSWTFGAYASLESNPDALLKTANLYSLSKATGRVVREATLDIGTLDSRWHSVLGAYGAFLSDVSAIIDAPLLADPTCPTTDIFRERLVDAEDARARAARDPSCLPSYALAVRDLEKAWEGARTYARRKGTSTLDPAEQDAMRRARALIDIALDDKAFPAERRAAMQKALAILRTVIDLPAQATEGLEQRVQRLELER